MTRTTEEFADKIIYLKENHFMPNTDNEMPDVQRAIQSFYFCSKSVDFQGHLDNNDSFWFRLTFTDYQVSDNFVKEVNREYKRFKILNIAKDEFER